jgi:hypothetical protein
MSGTVPPIGSVVCGTDGKLYESKFGGGFTLKTSYDPIHDPLCAVATPTPSILQAGQYQYQRPQQPAFFQQYPVQQQQYQYRQPYTQSMTATSPVSSPTPSYSTLVGAAGLLAAAGAAGYLSPASSATAATPAVASPVVGSPVVTTVTTSSAPVGGTPVVKQSTWSFLPSAQQAYEAYQKSSVGGTTNYSALATTLAGHVATNACPPGASSAQCLANAQQIYTTLRS